MKQFLLLPFLLLPGLKAVVHRLPAHGTSLAPRADQKAENLDSEVALKDPVSGLEIPKALILTGLGPDEASKRLFDWDESCTDKDDRERIVTAWRNVIKLSSATSTHLDQLSKGLPSPPSGRIDKANRKLIYDRDSPFAQFFRAQDSKISNVKAAFDKIKEMAEKPQDQRGSTPGALRFVCDKQAKIKNRAGTPFCGTDVQALTIAPWDNNTPDSDIADKDKPLFFEKKYNLEHATTIIFCPPFFDDNKFPSIDVRIASGDGVTLDKGDCFERILMHEMLHVKWVLDLPSSPDYIGYKDCADLAAKNGGIFKNPDSYAWYALYSYYNKGCNGDAWPAGEEKPVKPTD